MVDALHALLLRAPTPFSGWGVAAMCALFAAALMATFRRRLSPFAWRIIRTSLVAIVVLGGVIQSSLLRRPASRRYR